MTEQAGWTVEPGGPVRTVATGDVDSDTFLRASGEALDVLDAAGVPHVVMGGVAVAALGRPRWTHDLDVFLRPDDARRALAAFAEAGWETEEVDPLWLFKARRDGVLVDLIFRSAGNLYVDDQLLERARPGRIGDHDVLLIGPEDLVVVKAAAHREETGYHWFDAVALLARGDLDWEYLLGRARRAVRRVLSLLIYAESLDVAVPRWAIERLTAQLYEDTEALPHAAMADETPVLRATARRPSHEDGHGTATIEDEELRRSLRGDERVGDLDIGVHVERDAVVLTGDVATDERRRTLSEVAREHADGRRVENRTTVLAMDDVEVEELA